MNSVFSLRFLRDLRVTAVNRSPRGGDCVDRKRAAQGILEAGA